MKLQALHGFSLATRDVVPGEVFEYPGETGHDWIRKGMAVAVPKSTPRAMAWREASSSEA